MVIVRKLIGFLYRHIIKKFLFLYSPDSVHTGLVRFAKRWQAIPGLPQLVRWCLVPRKSDMLTQTIHGVTLQSPVGLSAGFDKNIELQPTLDMVGAGFMTGGSITLHPRKGNVRPWFYRLPQTKSLVVHAGLANAGSDVVLANVKRHQAVQRRMPLFVSVAVVACSSDMSDAEIIQDTCQAIQRVVAAKAAQAIEINISCPNVHDDQPFTQPAKLKQLLDAVDVLRVNLPVFIKMPNLATWQQFEPIVDEVVCHHVQGVTIGNLVKDRQSVELKDELSHNVKGGLSGEPCRVRSTELIRRTYQKYGDKLTIIGVGGIFTADDAYEKIRAGASLVALITSMIFEGPQVMGDIARGLDKRLQADGFSHLSEAVGVDAEKR